MDMTYVWIGLWIYLCIGLMASIGLINYKSEMVEKYEEKKKKGNRVRFLGKKGYIAFLMMATLFFWLPILIFPSKQS